MINEHQHFDKRHTDPLIKELIHEVREARHVKEVLVIAVAQIRADLKPIREFMEQITAAKTAAIWIVGVFAAIGAAITWILNVRDHIHKMAGPYYVRKRSEKGSMTAEKEGLCRM